jgi:hypothetical protein
MKISLAFTQVGTFATVRATASWSADTPLEITLSFGYDVHGEITWVFGRDLILDAMTFGQAGHGDVRVEIRDAVLTLRLSSPFGGIELQARASFLTSFVQRTYTEVSQLTEADTLPLTDSEIWSRILGEV